MLGVACLVGGSTPIRWLLLKEILSCKRSRKFFSTRLERIIGRLAARANGSTGAFSPLFSLTASFSFALLSPGSREATCIAPVLVHPTVASSSVLRGSVFSTAVLDSRGPGAVGRSQVNPASLWCTTCGCFPCFLYHCGGRFLPFSQLVGDQQNKF